MNKYYLDNKIFRLIGNGFFAVDKIKNVSSAKVLELIKEVIVKGNKFHTQLGNRHWVIISYGVLVCYFKI